MSSIGGTGMRDDALREGDVPEKVHWPKPRGRKKKPLQIAADTTIKALLAKGFSVRKVADTLGVSPTTIQRTKARLRREGEEISGLLTPGRDEKVAQLVDTYIGKGIKIRKIRPSDAIGAAKLYADRRWPLKGQEGGSVSISFTQVNIGTLESPDSNTIETLPEQG
jgi:hypothetical protein